MKYLILAIALSASFLHGQTRDVVAGFSINQPTSTSLMLPTGSFNAVSKFHFGNGFFINVNRTLKNSTSSSILWGLELSSSRFSFLIDGFSTYFINTSLKLPIHYCFTMKLASIVDLRAHLGANFQAQIGANSGSKVYSNNISFNRVTKAGLFPLLRGGPEFIFHTKSNRAISFTFLINKGFVNLEEITFSTTNPSTESLLLSNGSFYEFRFSYQIIRPSL